MSSPLEIMSNAETDTAETRTADVLVVGGGIAGVSIAADLALDHSVVLVETEGALAQHTTGRSAAVSIESYGHPLVRQLTKASRSLLMEPPPDLVDGPLCHPRSMMFVATESQRPSFDAVCSEQPQLEVLDRDRVIEMVPAFEGSEIVSGAFELDALDMDVGGLHQLFVRQLRHRGGEIDLSSPLRALTGRGDSKGWTATIGNSSIDVGLVVNAAGAWGDVVGLLAGAEPVGLTPCRRTIFTTPFRGSTSTTAGTGSGHGPRKLPARGWPLVVDVDEQFYFRNEGQDLLLCSPADETPSPPCDAKAEEIDVALGIERINAVTNLDIRTVNAAWAGLRTFSPDRAPVIGFDDQVDGFFWLVGQGGTGIQTAPGAAALAGSVIRSAEDPGLLGVARLRSHDR